MNKKELLKIFNDNFGNELLAIGYKLYDNGWQKKVNADYFIIDLSLTHRKNPYSMTMKSFRVEPQVIISLAQIEDVVRKLPSQPLRNSPTLYPTLCPRICEIEYYPDGIIKKLDRPHPDYKWIVHNEVDVRALSAELKDKIFNLGLTYITKNSSVERVYELLMNNLDKLIIDNFTWPSRIIRGLIAAKLLNKPNYEELKLKFDEIIINSPPNYQENYLYLTKNIDNLIK
jgi:hypothetical protein